MVRQCNFSNATTVRSERGTGKKIATPFGAVIIYINNGVK